MYLHNLKTEMKGKLHRDILFTFPPLSLLLCIDKFKIEMDICLCAMASSISKHTHSILTFYVFKHFNGDNLQYLQKLKHCFPLNFYGI